MFTRRIQKMEKIRSQIEFPLLRKYSKKFKITSHTIFAYNNIIYCNFPLTPDLLIHEKEHLRQQNEIGLDKWVFNFLNNPKERLEYELKAYKLQISSIKDGNQRLRTKIQCAKDLSSSLYGLGLNYEEALRLLK